MFDALGIMAERLARRASSHKAKQDDVIIAAHLDVVAEYGVKIQGYELNGRMHLCYDGEAFRQVLAMPASNEQKARAALAITASLGALCVGAPAFAQEAQSSAEEETMGAAASIPSIGTDQSFAEALWGQSQSRRRCPPRSCRISPRISALP